MMHCCLHAGGHSVDMQVVTFSDLPQSAFLLVRQVQHCCMCRPCKAGHRLQCLAPFA